MEEKRGKEGIVSWCCVTGGCKGREGKGQNNKTDGGKGFTSMPPSHVSQGARAANYTLLPHRQRSKKARMTPMFTRELSLRSECISRGSGDSHALAIVCVCFVTLDNAQADWGITSYPCVICFCLTTEAAA